MSKSIRLSPKYGVNPMIPCCFYCGREKNEIALLGKIGSKGQDIEAPKHAVIDYEPCDECKSMMENGIALIGVTDIEPDDHRPMIDAKNHLYPTGCFVIMTDNGVKQIFDKTTADELIKKKKGFMDHDALQHLIKSIQV